MKEKSLNELAQELMELVQEYELISGQLLSHPVFPHMPGAASMEEALALGHDSLLEGVQRSITSVQPQVEKLREALINLERFRDQVPADKLTN